MAANVESMFYVRETPWHGLGVKVDEAPTSADALRLAGLDWLVEQKEVFTSDGTLIPNFKANVRSSDASVLGIVSNKYKIIQNTEAFKFTDNLLGGGVRYETAGSLQNGKKIWLLAKMPTAKVIGEDVDPYIVFTNTHDGTSAIQVAMTPIRVVCNNTLNLALNSAKRKWSTKHMGDLASKMIEAEHTLLLASDYMKALDEEADRLANAKLYQEQVAEILDEMFPITEETTSRKIRTIEEFKENYWKAYDMADIAQYRNTAWGAINAMSDVVTHAKPKRSVTDKYAENKFSNIIEGYTLFDPFVSKVNQTIAA